MVSDMAYKIIKRAVILRAQAGEDSVENLVAIYTKLSEDQKTKMLEELAASGIVSKSN